MRPTRLSTLVAATLACALVTWLILRAVYQNLPPLPWTGVPALLFMAAAEAWTGHDLKARIAGRGGRKPADPLFVSRVVVLAKASSLVAAVVAGVCLGFVVYLSGLLSASVPKQDMINAGVTAGAAVILAVAALYLEYCCRVPGDRDRPRTGTTATSR
jgi:Protein of unknown function (DUF3180)